MGIDYCEEYVWGLKISENYYGDLTEFEDIGYIDKINSVFILEEDRKELLYVRVSEIEKYKPISWCYQKKFKELKINLSFTTNDKVEKLKKILDSDVKRYFKAYLC